MIIRRNAAATTVAIEEPDRTPLLDRFQGMGGTHAAAGIGAGALGSTVGVIAVGKGWMKPKTAGWTLAGTGAGTTAVGYYFDADHLMAAGAGMTTAGAYSLATQYSIEGFESIEKHAKEKRRALALKEAQAQLQSGQNPTTRNRLVIVERAIEGEEYDEYEDAA